MQIKLAGIFLLLLCDAGKAAPQDNFAAFNDLMQTNTIFEPGAIRRTLGIRMPPARCAFAAYLKPAPAFMCVSERRDQMRGASLQLRYFSAEEIGRASRGELAYGFPPKSCLTLQQAEIAFARHFRYDPMVVTEPGPGGGHAFSHVYAEYTDFGLHTYRLNLTLSGKCSRTLRIILMD